MAFLQKLFSSGPSPILGLDIGSSSVKLSQVVKSSESLRVVKLFVRPTPPLSVKEDGRVVEPGAIAAEVKEMVRQADVPIKRVVSAVSGPHVVIRTITMTTMTQRELKNSIKYEAERYLPYSVAEAQIDGAIVRSSIPGDEKNMEVLLMAAPKDVVYNVEEVIRQSGLQVEAIELEPIALLRLFQNCAPSDVIKQTVALINIGATATSINIFNDGNLRSSRTITIAGNSFTKAIGQAMNLSFEDAEKLKKEKGMVRLEKDATPVAPTTMRIFNIILPTITELVTEIQRSFDFYRSRYRKESVDLIYLSGGGSKLKNLQQYLAGELGLRVEMFNPLEKFGKSGIQGLTPEEAADIGQIFSVVLGLGSWHLT